MQDTKIKVQKQTHGKIDHEDTPSYNSTEDNKYIGINITKNVKDLYGKNFRSPKKEIEKSLEHGNVFCS